MQTTTRSRLLSLLEQEPDFISGEALAKTLGCTRGAVWKAVAQLRREGFQITAVTNKGYRLERSADILSKQGIESALKDLGCPESFDLRVFRSLGSTNTELKALASQGLPEGTTVISGEQTAGKGRMGRGFFSPSDTGLYLSLLLRPRLAAAAALNLTTAAAVAVAESIEAVTGRKTSIKWVNDVYLNDRKVCGILTEAELSLESGGLEYAVLGIGVNVYEPEGGFPEELRSIAGAIADPPENGLRDRLAANILCRFMAYYRTLDQRSYLPAYRERLMWVGENIRILQGSSVWEGTLLGADENCALRVATPQGEKLLSSGEISIRKAEKGDL